MVWLFVLIIIVAMGGALVAAILWLVVYGVLFLVRAGFFVTTVVYEQARENLDRQRAGVEDRHRISLRFIWRVFRDFRAGVYDRELEDSENLR